MIRSSSGSKLWIMEMPSIVFILATSQSISSSQSTKSFVSQIHHMHSLRLQLLQNLQMALQILYCMLLWSSWFIQLLLIFFIRFVSNFTTYFSVWYCAIVSRSAPLSLIVFESSVSLILHNFALHSEKNSFMHP